MPHGHGHDDDHGHGSCSGHSHSNDIEAPLLPPAAKGDHGHSHECHGHSHGAELPETDEDIRKLKMAVYLALFIMMVEIVGGVVSKSLAVIVDAAHMLSDVGGFIISLISLHLSKRAASEDFTYGFKQAEVLGAFLSIVIVWALTAILLFEAVQRIFHPPDINGLEMFVISVVGFVVNLILFKVLGHSHSHGDHGHSHGGDEASSSIAVQAAIAHVIGDIVQSLGVCLAAVLIWQKPFESWVGTITNDRGEEISRWVYADPCCTFLFGILVLRTTKSTIVFAMDSLMVKAPKHISQAELVEKLTSLPHVESIHDIHVWSLGSTEVLCTAHIMLNGSRNSTAVLEGAIKVAQGMGIGHTTFQLEIVGEFDPSMESYGGLKCGHGPVSPKTPSKELKAAEHGHAHDDHGDRHGHAHDGHGQAHDGHAHDGHAHDGDGCCGGHGGHDSGHGHAHGHDTTHSGSHGGHTDHGHSH